eukprot:tig00001590_g9382.t1
MSGVERTASSSSRKSVPALSSNDLALPNPFQSAELPPEASAASANGTMNDGSVPALERSSSPPRTPTTKSRQSDDGVPRYERLFRLSREIEAKKEARRASLEPSDTPQKFKTIAEESSKKGKRPSSAFKSKEPAHDPFPPQKGSPAPGKYDVPSIEAEALKAAAKGKLSATFTSSTPRLPEPKAETPGVGVYEVKKTGFELKGGIVKSTTPRFEEPKSPSPGPGVYEIDRPMSARGLQKSPSAAFKSAEKKTDLPVGTPVEHPAPGAYDPDSFVKAEQKKRPSSASFVSNLPRFEEAKSETPAVGVYEAKDVRKEHHVPNLKQTSERFKEPAPTSPGPWAYDPRAAEEKRAAQKSPSAVFKSAGKKTDLPVGTPVEHPAPGAYDVEAPLRADKMRISASFTSSTPRLPEPKSETPAVGVYSAKPGAFETKKNTMPSYSTRTPDRFPDPRASLQGPLSEYKPYTPVRSPPPRPLSRKASMNSPAQSPRPASNPMTPSN